MDLIFKIEKLLNVKYEDYIFSGESRILIFKFNCINLFQICDAVKELEKINEIYSINVDSNLKAILVEVI